MSTRGNRGNRSPGTFQSPGEPESFGRTVTRVTSLVTEIHSERTEPPEPPENPPSRDVLNPPNPPLPSGGSEGGGLEANPPSIEDELPTASALCRVCGQPLHVVHLLAGDDSCPNCSVATS